MIYVFEKIYECSRSAQVEADSFEEAKEMIANGEAEWDDSDDEFLISSKCIEYDDDADTSGEELEWKADY